MTEIDSSKNNGLLTKIWGPPLWESIHSMTFGYPLEPSDIQKTQYRDFFTGLGHVLPCGWCRVSYNKFITNNVIIEDKDLINRDALIYWGYRIHQEVNKKLGVDYGTTIEDLYDKYGSYRAKCIVAERGCTMPIDLKAGSYEWAKRKHAPIVTKEFSKVFVEYALMRGMPFYNDHVDKYGLSLMNSTEDRSKRIDRDAECVKIIDYMRLNSINCVETTGDSKGLPTKLELSLLARCCSTMNIEKQVIVEKLVRKRRKEIEKKTHKFKT